jgi:TM2 domain-containing membrane protein YozV
MIVLLLFSQFSLADSLYTHGYYDLAHVEYRRIFFFYPELKNTPDARFNCAMSLLSSGDRRGIEELQLMKNDFPERTQEINKSLAHYYIESGNYYQAGKLLTHTEEKKLLGFVYLLNGQYDDAHALFLKNSNQSLAQEIVMYMQKPKKSRETATLLSFICPGAGEIYAGNIKLGVMDFLLNCASGYLVYNAMKQKKYVDAALVFTFLFQRFYLGSIYNAQKTVIERNEIERQQWLEHIKTTYYP